MVIRRSLSASASRMSSTSGSIILVVKAPHEKSDTLPLGYSEVGVGPFNQGVEKQPMFQASARLTVTDF